jgi:hypothetical protein
MTNPTAEKNARGRVLSGFRTLPAVGDELEALVGEKDDHASRDELERAGPFGGRQGIRFQGEETDRDEHEQDRDLDAHDEVLRPGHGLGAQDVQAGEQDHRAADHQVLDQALVRPREEAGTVAPESVGIEGEHDDVAQPEKDVDAAGEHARPEGVIDETHRAALGPEPGRQLGVGVGGDHGDDAGQHEGDRRSAPGQLDRQPENGEDSPADHPADADG